MILLLKLNLPHDTAQGLGYHGSCNCFPRDPCIQIIPTFGPKVCRYYLHWAIWILRVLVSRVFRSILGRRIVGLRFLGFHGQTASHLELQRTAVIVLAAPSVKTIGFYGNMQDYIGSLYKVVGDITQYWITK